MAGRGIGRKGDAVREPYNSVLDALYTIHAKTQDQETEAVARLEERFAAMTPDSREATPAAMDEEEDEETDQTKPPSRTQQKEQQISLIRGGFKVQLQLISKTLTFVWLALMRAMRRIQGKGKPGDVREVAAALLEQTALLDHA